jgi:hypothetical protein
VDGAAAVCVATLPAEEEEGVVNKELPTLVKDDEV